MFPIVSHVDFFVGEWAKSITELDVGPWPMVGFAPGSATGLIYSLHI